MPHSGLILSSFSLCSDSLILFWSVSFKTASVQMNYVLEYFSCFITWSFFPYFIAVRWRGLNWIFILAAEYCCVIAVTRLLWFLTVCSVLVGVGGNFERLVFIEWSFVFLHRVYPPIFNIFPWLLHDQSFKIKDLLHALWYERECTEATSSRQGHDLLPLLPLRTMHKVPVTVQEDVEDTKIWSDYINVSLYWNAGWMKGTTLFCKRMPFNFPYFLWIFQNLESISMTFPGLEKEKGIPWLFQVFHDWIHLVYMSSVMCRGFMLINFAL